MAIYDHQEFSGRNWGALVPWPSILLFVMTFLFFSGGIVLDSMAGQVSTEKIRSLLLTSERTIDRKSAEEKEVVRDQLKPEDRNSLIQFEKEKADRLASSARLLYDMAKVSLGALLTCLAQMINAAVVAQRRSAPE